MSWTCPKCNRVFKKNNQTHSCFITNIYSHFIDKDIALLDSFEKILSYTSSFENSNVCSVKNAILFSSSSTYLAVKVKRNYIEFEFFLNEKVDDFPIYKTITISKNRIVHFVKIENIDEIDKTLLSWIKKSYELINLNAFNQK